MSKKRDPRIIDVAETYIERELKLIPIVPEDVAAKGAMAAAQYKSRKLLEIAAHVRLSTDHYVTADHSLLAPAIPAGLRELKFVPSAERTPPRERVYYADAALMIRRLGMEIRQQEHKRHGVKQTMKIVRSAKDKGDALDRDEIHAHIRDFGACFAVLDDARRLRELRKELREDALKPAFRMASQRLRVPYHPGGNRDVTIELAIDPLLFGETVFGTTWLDPKLEIEIVKGPASEAACRKILEHEKKRLMSEFKLAVQAESNAEIGYAYLAQDLLDPNKRAVFEKLKPDTVWWDRASRANLGLK